MNCPNCRSPLREGAAFCMNCGQKIVLPQECPNPAPTQAQMPEKRSKLPLILCLSIVLVAAAVVAIVLLLPKHQLDAADARERFTQELQTNREGIFTFSESCQMQGPVALYDVNGSGIEDMLYAGNELGTEGVMPYLYDEDGTIRKNDTNLVSDFILFIDRSDGTLYHYTRTYADNYTLYVLDGQLVRLGWYYYHPSEEKYGYSLNGTSDYGDLAQREYEAILDRLQEDEITVLLTTFDDVRLFAFFGHTVQDVSMTYDEALRYLQSGERSVRYTPRELLVSSSKAEAEKPTESTQTASPWLGIWVAESGETIEIIAATDTDLTLIYHHNSEAGDMLHTQYTMDFENAEKTVASEPGDVSQIGWKYTVELYDGYLTLHSRYPDKDFYRK